MVYGKFFSLRKWELFLQQRAAPGSGISFPEIEVLLCNIPSVQDLMDEEQDRHRLQQGRSRDRFTITCYSEVGRGTVYGDRD